MTWKLENLPQIKIIDGQKNLGLEFFKDIKKSDKLKALSPTPFYGIGLQIQDFLPGAATRGVLWKKLLLEISQNSQENTCARACPAILLKKRLWGRCFPVNFVKFLRTPFLQNTSGRLLLVLRRLWLWIGSYSKLFGL